MGISANTGHSRVDYGVLPEQASDPSALANTGFLYTKDVSSITELFYEDSAGNVTQLTSGGTSENIWDRNTGSGYVYLHTITDNVTIGGSTPLAKLSVDGDTDEIQFLVQGNGTQTNLLAVFENSSGTDQITFSNTGAAVFNEAGNAADFRIETDTISNALHVEGTLNAIGIGYTPLSSSYLLRVNGRLRAGDQAATLATFSTNNTQMDIVADGNFRFPLAMYAFQSNDLFGAQTQQYRSGGLIATPAGVEADMILGGFQAHGMLDDLTWGIAGAAVLAIAEDTQTITSQATYLTFYTTAGGSATILERARIDSAGNFGIGTPPETFFHVKNGDSGISPTGQIFYENNNVLNIEYGFTAGANLQHNIYEADGTSWQMAFLGGSDKKFQIFQSEVGVFFKADSTEIALNDGSASINTRVESDGNANMLFVDGINNAVIIGSGSIVETNTFQISTGFVNYGVRQGTVNTTNATPTTIITIGTTVDNAYLMQVNVVAKRTGGSSGSTNDAATYIRTFRVKNAGGTITFGAIQTDYTDEDQVAWDCTVTSSGSSVLVQGTGAANNNITWDCTALIQKCSG